MCAKNKQGPGDLRRTTGRRRGLTISAQEPESGLAPRQRLFLRVLSQLHPWLAPHGHQLQKHVWGCWTLLPQPMIPLAHPAGSQILSLPYKHSPGKAGGDR